LIEHGLTSAPIHFCRPMKLRC